MTFLITYDAHKIRNYVRLYQLLASWKAIRVTESLWLANLRGPAGIIRDIVARHMDNDDSVAVFELKQGADWATVRIRKAANAFLSAYVTPSEKAA